MNQARIDRRAYGSFAEILQYPRPGLARVVRECRTLVAELSAEAAELLGQFAEFVEQTPHEDLEEAFTAGFDLNAACHLYVGYQLVGETYIRSALLLGLKERYRRYGLDPGSEVPDHLALILRFLALCDDENEASELIGDAVLPALEPMLAVKPEEEPVDDEGLPAQPEGREQYRRVLQALRLVLQAQYGESKGFGYDALARAAAATGT